MILTEVGLVNPAMEASMKMPNDIHNYNPDEFPHWHVFVNIQIGRVMTYSSSHFLNAKIIAGIEDEDIMHITLRELEKRGLS